MTPMSRYLIAMTSGKTSVCESLLLDDAAFLSLVDSYKETRKPDEAVAHLCDFVNSNY